MRPRVRRTFRFVAATALIALLSSCSRDDLSSPMVFADISNLWWNIQPIFAHDDHIFEKNNLTVKRFVVSTGKEAKNAVARQKADIGVVAATPLIYSALGQHEDNLVVLASYFSSPSLVAIVSNSQIIDGVPQPIAYVEGTVSEFFLAEAQNRLSGQPFDKKATQLLSIRPPDSVSVLTNGDISSIAIWEPYAQTAIDALDDKGVTPNIYRPDNIYTMRFFIITNRKTYEARTEELSKFITSIKDTSQKIKNTPDLYQRRLEEKFGYSPGWLSSFWGKIDLTVTEDSDLLKAYLVEEATIAKKSGVIKEIPSFKEIMK